MITKIKLKESFEENILRSKNEEITNLSTLNIFIGSNNSGKSRILRSIFSNHLVHKTDNSVVIKTNQVVATWNKQVKAIMEKFKVNAIKGHTHSDLQVAGIDYWKEGGLSGITLIKETLDKFKSFSAEAGHHASFRTVNASYAAQEFNSSFSNLFNDILQQITLSLIHI